MEVRNKAGFVRNCLRVRTKILSNQHPGNHDGRDDVENLPHAPERPRALAVMVLHMRILSRDCPCDRPSVHVVELVGRLSTCTLSSLLDIRYLIGSKLSGVVVGAVTAVYLG